MKRLLSFIVGISLFPFTLAAPPSRESVERLLELTSAEDSWSSVPKAFQRLTGEKLQAIARDGSLTPGQLTKLHLAKERVDEEIQRFLAWQQVKPDIVRMYVDTFDDKEVSALIEFYSGEAGRAYVAKMPALRQTMMRFGQVQAEALQPKLQRIVEGALSGEAADERR